LKFEENPYHFKKNVVSYSSDELISLNEVLSGDFCNENLNLLMSADSGQTFEKFKSGTTQEDSYFPLLIRIITKLPFVHYIPQSNQLDNIESFVIAALDEQDIHLLDLICSRELTQKSMDSLIKESIARTSDVIIHTGDFAYDLYRDNATFGTSGCESTLHGVYRQPRGHV
jgi:hypothetical protein